MSSGVEDLSVLSNEDSWSDVSSYEEYTQSFQEYEQQCRKYEESREYEVDHYGAPSYGDFVSSVSEVRYF